jgi:hypothetical protein
MSAPSKKRIRSEESKAKARAHACEVRLRRKREGLCAACGHRVPLAGRTLCEPCVIQQIEAGRKTLAKLREEVIQAYGGPRCMCCGETERAFLCIDHVNGGGYQHRKEIGTGSFYRWLRKNGFPTGFQVLCFNCNMGKLLNGGVCPHQARATQPSDGLPVRPMPTLFQA